jgi:hypothetical protein
MAWPCARTRGHMAHGGWESRKPAQSASRWRRSTNASTHLAGPQRRANRALPVLPHSQGHRSTARPRCHPSGARLPRPAANNCADSRPVTGAERGVRKCVSGSRRREPPPWAAPWAAAVPRVWGVGLGQRTRAGSARTCTFPHLGQPPRSSAATSRNAHRPAVVARRGPGATSAAGHHDVVQAKARPLEAAAVVGVLALAPQLSCAEAGRPAPGRRPASLSMAVHAVKSARSRHLRYRGRRPSQVKRGTG